MQFKNPKIKIFSVFFQFIFQFRLMKYFSTNRSTIGVTLIVAKRIFGFTSALACSDTHYFTNLVYLFSNKKNTHCVFPRAYFKYFKSNKPTKAKRTKRKKKTLFCNEFRFLDTVFVMQNKRIVAKSLSHSME